MPQFDGCDQQDAHELVVASDDSGLFLHWFQTGKSKPIRCAIDIQGFIARQTSFPSNRKNTFSRALGRQSRTVLDATGGWGGDALLMCAQGLNVTIVERNPIMAVLLKDAMQRLTRSRWATVNNVSVPRVIAGDAQQVLLQATDRADCVYLDPMFPPKRKKSAASNKYMQLLSKLLQDEHDADQLLASALSSQSKRVVVKRPHYANPLLHSRYQPHEKHASKLVHYDVYLLNNGLN